MIGTRTGLTANKVSNTIRTLTAEDLARSGGSTFVDALSTQVGSVNINQVEGNPYQADVNFRGFTASPVGGTPIGIAVYQNGIRINEGFGDTVNWDLVPTFAIRALNMTSANPVFGLNTLGGAVTLQMKDGSSFEGAQAEVSGGSFGRHTETAEYGMQDGPWGIYVGANLSDEDGWRVHMPSHVRQTYTDIGYTEGKAEVHLSYTWADNTLLAMGPTPINLLAQNFGAGIDYPGNITNTVNTAALNAEYSLTKEWTLAANVYNRQFGQYNINGAPTSSIPCVAPLDPETFCSPNPATGAQEQLFGPNGEPVPLSVGGAYPAESDYARTATNTWGGTAQATSTSGIFGLDNNFIVGSTLIGNSTNYGTGAVLGMFNPARFVVDAIPVNSNGGTDTNIRLHADNTYTTLYATDTLSVTKALAVTASLGYNMASIHLMDLLGTKLNGSENYQRLDKSGGFTYQLPYNTTAFFNYSENNRVPTPQELECADPSTPCILATSFIADPPLKGVVAVTMETGLRGLITGDDDAVRWNLSLFNTHDFDDIYSIPSQVLLHGYYENAGDSQRQGMDLSLQYDDEKWHVGFDYSLLLATFQSNIALSSPFNPYANAAGEIFVHPGDIIPGEPRNRVRLNADYSLTPQWTIGAMFVANSDQILKGDEANLTPPVPGYAILGLRTTYSITDAIQLFGNVDNVLNQRYYTFGTYTTETGLPMPPGTTALGIVRSYGPGAPIGGWLGIRCKI